jgi:hypothetical protein
MIVRVAMTIIIMMMGRIALTHPVVAMVVDEFTVATVEFTLATVIMIVAAVIRFRSVAMIRKRRRRLQVEIANAVLKTKTVRVREFWR